MIRLVPGVLVSIAALAGCATVAESLMRSEGMADTIYVKPPEGGRTDVLLQFTAFVKARGMACTIPLNSPPELVTICERRGETFVAVTNDDGRLKFLVFTHPRLPMLSKDGEDFARKYVRETALLLRTRLQAVFGSAVTDD
jgi:hypothetical protein